MKQRRSVLSLAAVFVVIFVVLISSFFVAAETNHDCTGEDCPICYEISVCQETVRKLTFACAVFAAILLLSVCIAGGSGQTGCLPYINFSEGEAFGLKK